MASTSFLALVLSVGGCAVMLVVVVAVVYVILRERDARGRGGQ